MAGKRVRRSTAKVYGEGRTHVSLYGPRYIYICSVNKTSHSVKRLGYLDNCGDFFCLHRRF